MDREGNEALLGIFFGRLGVEVEGPLLDGTFFFRILILGRCSWRPIFNP